MVKPEWGLKRACQSCGARFYDMGRSPIVCPKCGTVLEPETVFKASKRPQPPAPEPKSSPVPGDEALDIESEGGDVEGTEDEEIETDENHEAIDDEDGDGDLIEDASDLGEDDDDMAEVMEHFDDNIEDEV